MKKNILITGALGFLGYNLSKVLVNNFPMYNVIGIDNEQDEKYRENKDSILKYNNYYYIKGNVLDKKLVREIFLINHSSLSHFSDIHGIDVAYTTAFESLLFDISKEGLEYYENNMLGAMNIAIEYILSKSSEKKLIYLSSCYVYGFSDTEKPFSEDSPLSPISRNATIKLSVEMLLRSLHYNFGLPIVILRLPSIFGDGMKGDHLLMNIINAVIQNRSLEINFSPKSIINAIFYEDLIIGLESFIPFKASFNIFNMGGVNITISDFINIVIDTYQNITGDLRSGDIFIFKNKIQKNCCISSNNVYKSTGWKNYTTIEYGVEKTLKRMLNA
ncbi:MAG: NAD(P)-dependent oxidoreductase [Calditerrivibrio sp.]|nr:NAD(P)-dependent oxidoreductase [Calditerrivibrio sp.]MCA1980014.1 NAD(P)-dependent oxidoreductase [Calditerrivibrio sp.]